LQAIGQAVLAHAFHFAHQGGLGRQGLDGADTEHGQQKEPDGQTQGVRVGTEAWVDRV